MEKALQGRQKHLKESIFRPLQGSVNTTPYPQGWRPGLEICRPLRGSVNTTLYPQGWRPGLEICRPLRGSVERLNGVLQQSLFFAPTAPPLAGFLAHLAFGPF